MTGLTGASGSPARSRLKIQLPLSPPLFPHFPPPVTGTPRPISQGPTPPAPEFSLLSVPGSCFLLDLVTAEGPGSCLFFTHWDVSQHPNFSVSLVCILDTTTCSHVTPCVRSAGPPWGCRIQLRSSGQFPSSSPPIWPPSSRFSFPELSGLHALAQKAHFSGDALLSPPSFPPQIFLKCLPKAGLVLTSWPAALVNQLRSSPAF